MNDFNVQLRINETNYNVSNFHRMFDEHGAREIHIAVDLGDGGSFAWNEGAACVISTNRTLPKEMTVFQNVNAQLKNMKLHSFNVEGGVFNLFFTRKVVEVESSEEVEGRQLEAEFEHMMLYKEMCDPIVLINESDGTYTNRAVEKKYQEYCIYRVNKVDDSIRWEFERAYLAGAYGSEYLLRNPDGSYTAHPVQRLFNKFVKKRMVNGAFDHVQWIKENV